MVRNFLGKTMGILLAVIVSAAAWAQGPYSPDGLWAQATLYRDEWGVPHVYADNVRAMAFAFGQAQADDHLEPMLLAYRVATGRAAEVMGPAYADSDEFALKMGHAELAAEAWRRAPPLTVDLCEGFAVGVNAWLAGNPDRAPEWADGVEPEDILALLHCYLMSFAPFDLPDVFHRPAPAFSGNAWAVGPMRSATGETMLAINPHTRYDGPFQWYEAHLAAPGFDVAGATLFGLPVILQGHNAVLGWALTPNASDFADMYMVPESGPAVAPGNPMAPAIREQYEIARMVHAAARTKSYFVRTPQGQERRYVQCMASTRGPIVGGYLGRQCAYHIGGYRDFGALEQLVAMGAATGLEQFQDALAMHQLPCFNVLYADRDGNIFYLYNTKTGDRFMPAGPGAFPAGQEEEEDEGRGGPLGFLRRLRGSRGGDAPPEPAFDWSAPLPGGESRAAWGPILPVAALPAILNPPSGYLQICGSPPWRVTEGLDLYPDDWPEWIAQDRDTFRAQRVRHLLGLGPRSFTEMQAMLYDVLAPYATVAVPRLLELADAKPDFVARAHPDLAAGLHLLRTWNGVAEVNSPGMTFFHAWWAAFKAMARPNAPPGVLQREFLADPQALSGPALEAAAEAARQMRNQYDSLTVPWGDVHVLQRGDHEIPMPGGSAGDPVLTTAEYVFDRGRLQAGYGYAFAMVVRFGEYPEAVSVAPFGASSNPDSPHFADQMDLLAERRFKVTRFLNHDVQRYAASAVGRRPILRPVGMQGVFRFEAERPVQVRLDTETEAPAPLPDGAAPFSVYVRPVARPAQAGVALEMAVFVPDVLCAQADLDQLALYAYDRDHGWMPLAHQELNPRTRVFQARDTALRVYAVLGPQSARQSPARIEAEAPPPLEFEEIAPAPPPPPPPPPAAQAVAPPPLSALADRVTRTGFAWGDSVVLEPEAGRVMVRLNAARALGTYLRAHTHPPAALPPGMGAYSDFLGVTCSEEAPVRLVVALRPDPGPAVADLALYAYDAASGWTRLPDQRFEDATGCLVGADDAPRLYAVLGPGSASADDPVRVAEGPADRPESLPPVPVTDAPDATDTAAETPPPVTTARPTEPVPTAPAPAQPAGPTRSMLRWGAALELEVEGGGAIRVQAERPVGMYLLTGVEPPAPLPEGLAAFSDLVEARTSTAGVSMQLAITLVPRPGACAPEDLSQLVLYAYDAASGWSRVAGQAVDAEAGAISGSDTAPRVYALLGPADRLHP